MTTKLGTKVRDLRKLRGLTLDALAQKASMSKSYLWELENREAPNPTAEKITAIAAVLETPVTYFIDDAVDALRQSDLDSQFFRGYEKLDVEQRKQLHRILKTFLTSDDDQ